jgi:hypothetical protein
MLDVESQLLFNPWMRLKSIYSTNSMLPENNELVPSAV